MEVQIISPWYTEIRSALLIIGAIIFFLMRTGTFVLQRIRICIALLHLARTGINTIKTRQEKDQPNRGHIKWAQPVNGDDSLTAR